MFKMMIAFALFTASMAARADWCHVYVPVGVSTAYQDLLTAKGYSLVQTNMPFGELARHHYAGDYMNAGDLAVTAEGGLFRDKMITLWVKTPTLDMSIVASASTRDNAIVEEIHSNDILDLARYEIPTCTDLIKQGYVGRK